MSFSLPTPLPLGVTSLAAVLLLLLLVYNIGLTFYRLVLHPLAGFPGPRLAAASFWYEYYYDCHQRGQYVFKLEQLHKQYGPIIRINPEEIHISDPEFYNEVYTNKEKRDAWGWQRKGFGSDLSTMATVDHDLHRHRRAAWNPVFSKQRIARLQPVIQERVDALMSRMGQAGQNCDIVNLKHGLAAYVADVASRYFFDIPQCKIEDPDFDPEFHDAVQDGFNNVMIMNHFPWLMDILVFMAHYPPPGLLRKYFVSTKMTKFVTVLRLLGDQAKAVAARPMAAKEEAAGHTVFDQILSSRLPHQDKTLDRLKQDAQMLICASTLSTSWSIGVATYELVKRPSALRKLKEELSIAFPDGPETMNDLPKLESLSYLSAVIQESLRIGIAISHRSARVSRKEMVYKVPGTSDVWVIPRGTPTSMSHGLILRDKRIFPRPTEFIPERWLDNPGLERYQVVFGKGSRICPAINLATAMMILPIVSIFGRYGSPGYTAKDDIGRLELFETDDSDIECVSDGMIAMPKKGSKGMRFRVTSFDRN
ncbi:hypothetical protein E4T42_07730 [Aureobasidium subglaciale]|nr:hypothetical protein E4T42_07730 [Aureobasidium subglaciale]